MENLSAMMPLRMTCHFKFIGLISLFLFSCSGNYTPKPKGYFRIDLPEKKYQEFKPSSCPFSFEYPVYSKIEQDSSRNAIPCWYNIVFPSFRAKIHLSYKSVHGDLNSMIEDARSLAYKHTVKADQIEELPVNTEGAKGTLYEIKGSAASSVQFYLTDSAKHFFRGSLYFYAEPQPDSLAPVLQFVRDDIGHLIKSFRWK